MIDTERTNHANYECILYAGVYPVLWYPNYCDNLLRAAYCLNLWYGAVCTKRFGICYRASDSVLANLFHLGTNLSRRDVDTWTW